MIGTPPLLRSLGSLGSLGSLRSLRPRSTQAITPPPSGHVNGDEIIDERVPSDDERSDSHSEEASVRRADSGEESEGEDLMDNMEADYRPMEHLDRYADLPAFRPFDARSLSPAPRTTCFARSPGTRAPASTVRLSTM
jgi:hypothetical protein